MEKTPFTLLDDRTQKDIMVRSKEGIICIPYVTPFSLDHIIASHRDFLIQSADGTIIIFGSEKELVALQRSTRKQLFKLQFNRLLYLFISPSQKYLQVLNKLSMQQAQILLVSLPDGKVLATLQQHQSRIFLQTQMWPLLKFTKNDKSFFHRVKDSLHQYWIDQPNKPLSSLIVHKTQNYDLFDVSPFSTRQQTLLLQIRLGNQKKKGEIRISQNCEKQLYKKQMQSYQGVRIRWCDSDFIFLIELQNFIDKENKSYYGQSQLKVYLPKHKVLKKLQTVGPIHDFSFRPGSTDFVVISGFMPAIQSLYVKFEKAFDFGKSHRNTIIWSQLGRFMITAGFGNLAGDVDVWDVIQRKRIGHFQSNATSACTFSPCSRKILTAVLTPKLRVDNNYKVFSYSGELLFSTQRHPSQLYQVIWCNSKQIYEPRGASPGRRIFDQEEFKKSQKQKKIFKAQGTIDLTAQLQRQGQRRLAQKMKEKEAKDKSKQQQARKRRRRRKKKQSDDLI